MTNRDEPFQPASVEERVNRLLTEAASRSTEPTGPESRLIQDLCHVHADDTLSGERVWARLVERLGEPNATPPHLRILTNHPVSVERKHSMSSPEVNTIPSQVAEPPRGLRRVFALVAAALVVTLLVGSSMWLFSAMHTLPQHTTTSQRGTASVSIGKLLCHTSYTTQSTLVQVQPPLSWSARGMIAAADPYLKIFSGQTCAPQSLINLPRTSVSPVWSPDGKRLLLLHGDVADVLDAMTGRALLTFLAGRSTGFAQAVWAPGGTQIIFSEVNILSHTTQSVNIQVWDANSGALIRTALTFNSGILIGSTWISPNGQYLAAQGSDHKITFWNIGTGKAVSTTASSVAGNSQPVAWLPNGAALAIGLPNANWPAQPSEVQIWSSATGQLTATFLDANTFEGDISGLAWSSNGQYLAESSVEIHIWNASTGKLMATFGKTTAGSEIVSVAWAPGNSRLASATTTFPTGPGSKLQKTLEVWQLS